jgi:Tfp pilus assembly protein FimT
MARTHCICTASGRRSDAQGFSLLELVLVTATMMVLSAIAVPQILSTMRTYQVTSAASQVADAIKFSRFEAIRSNVNVAFRAKPSGSTWIVWTDSNNDNIPDAPERQYQFAGTVTSLPTSSVPSAGNLASAVGVASLTVLSGSGSTQTITFDPRGAVNPSASTGGATTVYVFYVGPTTNPDQEYRAVVVMPSGVTQVWTGTPSGTWRQIS